MAPTAARSTRRATSGHPVGPSLVLTVVGLGGPYTYSDMTGYTLNFFTAPKGRYDVLFFGKGGSTPLATVPARLSEFDSTKTYLVHCKMGGRSAQAVEIMRKAGLNAINITGGITAWAKEIDRHMPVY